MASLFGHIAASAALGKILAPGKMSANFWMLTFYCSVLPDADVIAFYVGIPYGNLLGHRGLSHSLLFAFAIGFAVAYFFFRQVPRYSAHWWKYAFFFVLVLVSHALTDAISNGGLGVAFLAPFSNERYFLPWRPLEVSPIGGLIQFFGREGWRVMRSEFVWIWLPSIAFVLISVTVKRFTSATAAKTHREKDL